MAAARTNETAATKSFGAAILALCEYPRVSVNIADQRVNSRRCCCRRPGIGAGGVGAPNSRSKNDGPE